jgi:hypothetical protein
MQDNNDFNQKYCTFANNYELCSCLQIQICRNYKKKEEM